MLKGLAVAVYEDPVSKKRFEGAATIVKVIEVMENGVYAYVRFKNEREIVPRFIHVPLSAWMRQSNPDSIRKGV